MMDQLEIGVITSTHGLRGEVYVYPTTDDIHRFEKVKDVLLVAKGKTLSLTVERVSFFKGRVIVKFRGLDAIEDVEKFRGLSLFVERKDAIPLKKGEYFIGDLVGSRVFLEDGTSYGQLVDIFRTGANDVYEIKMEDGSTAYLPAIRDCVISVDAEKQEIVVRPMKEI
ncbi:MAG: ribosome maturation factor RimM [Lachnospiraceae bacterium]|nr:ribosome maturation factor RimM [Lachnospiraceae bacterium]